jgi:hypothetical protein
MRYRQAYAVTKSDTADIRVGDVSDALWIGTPGDGTLSVIMEDGKQADFKGVAAGEFRLAVKRVRATGSGAADILALKY